MTQQPADEETAEEQKQDWTSWRVWRISAGFVFAASFIISALGLWAVYVQLDRGLEHRKADIALGFVERFNTLTYVRARNNLLKPWLKFQDQLALANAHDGLSKEQIDQLTTLIIQQDREQNGSLESDILTVVNFFDELSICVSEGICDARTSCFYFQKRAADFQVLYGSSLKNLQAVFNLEDPEKGLNEIANLTQCLS
ncbi:MAG: hypothetical protein AAGF54_09885 [Pseudomonadota bacterium]